MRRCIFCALLGLLVAGSTYADDTSFFTFDDGLLAEGDSDLAVSVYMTLRHPGIVVANGAIVHSGDGFGDDLYLWTRSQLLNPGNILILLTSPVNYVSFDGYVFDATSNADFTFTAYSLDAQIIHQQSWNAGVGSIGTYSTGMLPEMAYGLSFSDSGKHDIGIDNLRIGVVPAPGAGLLVVLGTALAGGLRRRQTL